jgi:hypothetical protein
MWKGILGPSSCLSFPAVPTDHKTAAGNEDSSFPSPSQQDSVMAEPHLAQRDPIASPRQLSMTPAASSPRHLLLPIFFFSMRTFSYSTALPLHSKAGFTVPVSPIQPAVQRPSLFAACGEEWGGGTFISFVPICSFTIFWSLYFL